MNKRAWLVRQRARLHLLYAQNCAHATLLSLEVVFNMRAPLLMKAATNLEGGIVGCGETCGVVTAGMLAIGGLLSNDPIKSADDKEKAIHRHAGAYKRWFETRFGSSCCRERVGVDFSTARGLIRYLLPGDKLLRCLHHVGEAVWYLTETIEKELFIARITEKKAELHQETESQGPTQPHCTLTVLSDVYPDSMEFTPYFKWATTGLAGGIALSGATCGALIGGIMALGLAYGYDPRTTTIADISAAFVRGHWHLLRPKSPPSEEAFAASRFFLDNFKGRFNSIQCKDIASRSFSSPQDLRGFLDDSTHCKEVMSWCTEQAREMISSRSHP